MSFLRRLLGGSPDRAVETSEPTEPTDSTSQGSAAPPSATPPEDDEAARDRELLRADAKRLDDELLQRQLRYADRAWTPPAQGGERRADDGDGGNAG